MRYRHYAIVLIAILTLLLWSCSGSDESDVETVELTTTAADSITAPPGQGVIHVVTGPYSPEIVSKGFYHLRSQLPLRPFELGAHQYALMDSIANYEVIGYEDIDGFEVVVDSLDPGLYTMLVYVSRLSKAETKLDTAISATGDTTITDPTKAMAPYDYYFRPILVDSIVVSAGQVSEVDLSTSLEKWERPKQTDKGWEAPRARYLKYGRSQAEVR